MAEINPLRYRGYYFDSETGFYYLQSRYYDPTTCRFINADAYASTGQGVLGHNMFAYCLNNAVSRKDPYGMSGAAVANVDDCNPLIDWGYAPSGGGGGGTGAGGAVIVVGADVIGDIGFIGFLELLFGPIKFNADDSSSADEEKNTEHQDEDWDDEYYEDDSNFGGIQKIGKPKGKTPGNNQRQNKDFRKATKDIDKKQKRYVHEYFTGQGAGYHDIVDFVNNCIIKK